MLYYVELLEEEERAVGCLQYEEMEGGISMCATSNDGRGAACCRLARMRQLQGRSGRTAGEGLGALNLQGETSGISGLRLNEVLRRPWKDPLNDKRWFQLSTTNKHNRRSDDRMLIASSVCT